MPLRKLSALDVEKYLSQLSVQADIVCIILDRLSQASQLTSLALEDLLIGLDFEVNNTEQVKLEAFLAELRSIFWLRDHGFDQIAPVPAKKKVRSPDFTASYRGKRFIVEVFCLTSANEQKRDESLNCYVNATPNSSDSKFSKAFLQKAEMKKVQLEAAENDVFRLLLCVSNHQFVNAVTSKRDFDEFLKMIFMELGWGPKYYFGILTGREDYFTKEIDDTIYPRLEDMQL